jgi:acetylornithine/succinyldiaminopimelate/putrescine aminotransferase/predicted amino acid dehydrogenase
MHPYAEYVNPKLARQLYQICLDKVYARGEGCELYDNEGNKYLDFIAAYGALPFGFNPPEIWEAITEVRDTAEPSFVQPSYLDAAGQLAQQLIAIAPPGMGTVTFANSGAEAVEAAFKIARNYTQRLGILTTHNSFHGKTLGALSATGKDSYQKGFGAPVAGFDRIPYGDAEALKTALEANPGKYAALIVEPIQGEGGIIIPPDGYLKTALELCHRCGTLLIVDEVQAGLGRTGHFFACEHDGITPDIMTVAKALGGGLIPIGACIAKAEVYTEDFALKHSSTFAGNTIACRVGLRVLDMLTRDQNRLLGEIERKGRYLLSQLKEIQHRYPQVIAAVRGRGLMLGLELGVTKENMPDSLLGIMAEQEYLSPIVSSYLLNVEKLRVAPTLNGVSVIRLEPSLIISDSQCEYAMAAVERMAARLAEGNTASFLAHMIGVSNPAVSPRQIIPKKIPRPSDDPAEGRFAFLVHPLYLKNYIEFDSSLKIFSEQQLGELVGRWNDLIEPFVAGQTVITSKTGQKAYGEFIAISRTSEELMQLPKEQVRKELEAAVKLAKDRGARIVGLGAYTSVVSKGGRELRDLGVAVTTGNSYTVAAAVEATLEAARQLNIAVDQTTVAVVGATGSIGRATTFLLAEEVNALILIGNPNNQQHSRRRLMKVTAEIYQYLNKTARQGGAIVDFVKRHPRIPAPNAPLVEYQEFAETVINESPIIYTVEIGKYLPQADLVVTATSQVNSLIQPGMLKFGAVVCDVARPADVSIEVKEARPDVLVIDGGVMAVPGQPDLGWNFGFEQGLAYACMSETMMLALEHRYEHFSLGVDITIDTIQYFRDLAEKHGFKLAGFRSFDRPLDPETFAKVQKARGRQLVYPAIDVALSS